jgi:hypothetical protein
MNVYELFQLSFENYCITVSEYFGYFFSVHKTQTTLNIICCLASLSNLLAFMIHDAISVFAIGMCLILLSGKFTLSKLHKRHHENYSYTFDQF